MSRRVAAGLAAALALLAAAAVVTLGGGSGSPADAAPVEVADDAPALRLTALREPGPDTLGAVARVDQVGLYDSPDAEEAFFALPNPTHENVPLTFSVDKREGDRLFVRVPMRPNETTAWIDADQVITHPIDQRIVVDLSDRRLTLFEGDRKVMSEPVAVGAPSTPTPLGDFYVDISLPDPGGPYGAHMLSVAGFSDVLRDFGGGIGQIAIHGWNDPSVMGQAVSNGCIRLPNGTITHLADQVRVGTPVKVKA